MRWPKTPKPGDPILAEWAAAVVEILSQVIRPRPPLRFERNRNGVELVMDDVAGGAAIYTVKSPPGGIAPGMSAVCYRHKKGEPGTLTGTTVTIKNHGPDPVPENRRVYCGTQDGVADSALFWSCNEVA